MHIPDGFINLATSAGAGVIAGGGVGVSLKRARLALEEKTAPLAGLVSAFIFAAQMLNFPVAAGTSGHLIGGALAAILLGPWVGVVCLTVVLVVQAFLFADGGLTALGLNIVNMALVTVLVAYPLFLALKKILPASKSGIVAASGIAAGFSVVAPAVAFVAEYAIGGTTSAPLGAVAAAMAGVHTLIGIGEGVITGITVGAVFSVRPDLVYGARDLLPKFEIGVRAR